MTMNSSLGNQLKAIKVSQNVLIIGPNQQQPSILFDKNTARNTSIDTIYSMCIIAYDKISHHLSNSLEQVQNREELLGEGLKEINRNMMSKEQNAKLSRKLEKFIIELAPYLLNSECQHIFEYLLRNFKVNVFETQTLALALLQYWNFEIYQKVIENINKRQMVGKLTFLNQMTSSQQINFSFIIKTLTFSHAILDKLISIILQASLIEIKTSKDQLINFNQNQIQDEQIVKHPLKNFLLKIFLSIIKQKKTNHYKYIIEFCSSCIRIKYTNLDSSSNSNIFELISMVLVLLANLIFENGISDDYLVRTVKKLLSKFINVESNVISQKNKKQIFDFLMVVWQRKTNIVDLEIVQILAVNHSFINYLKKFSASKYMIFIHLWMLKCYEGAKCQALINTIGLSIKNEQFFKLHESKFISQMIQIYQKCLIESTCSKQDKTWLVNYLKNTFKYQVGVWINQHTHSNRILLQNLIQNVFEPSEVDSKNHTVQIKKIKRVLDEKKLNQSKNLSSSLKDRLRQQKPKDLISQQSEQEQNKNEKPVTKPKKLIQYVRAKGIQVTQTQLNYQDQAIKTCLIQLFLTSYDQKTPNKTRINSHQKVFILQKYFQSIQYTTFMLQKDLQNEQFALLIKYFILKQQTQKQTQQPTTKPAPNTDNQFQTLQTIFTFILNKKQLLENILFKELFRLVLNKMLVVVQLKYKQVVQFLHKYYKKFISTCKNNIELVEINCFILKISEKVFDEVGNNKGKYQSLIHTHCKLLSVLINNIDSHELTSKSTPIVTHEMLVKTYRTLIKIFGVKELYLINIGIIQLITRKELNYKKLKYFIDDIMVSQLNVELQTQKQSQISLNYYQHAISIGRCLIFSSYMLGSNDSDWFDSIEPILTSGIAKNQISIFYGLIKDKLKKNIAKKMFLFFKLTYQSKKFVSGFKNYLATIEPTQMTKLLHIYSQLYYILLSIQVKDANIQNLIEKLLDQITNLFPLQLRLTLFKPILPNQKLYAYLTNQLQVHSEANFNELSQLVNITPNQLSIEWVDFIKEGLKRDHKLTTQCVETIFTNEHFLNSEDNFQVYCQLICYLSEYQKDVLVPYVNQSMNIILAVCSTNSNPDYCLSIIYKVIINLKQLVDPYVHDIYKYALENNSEFVEKFIADTVQYLTIPTLIQTVKSLSKVTQHLYNFGLFFKHVCRVQNVGHLLSKTLQYYASKTIHSAIQDEVNLENLYELQADIFLEMTLKFNQNELRKILIDFVRWSQTKQNQEAEISFNVRKIVLAEIYIKLSENLKNLFTPFYGYVFDSYLKDMETITSNKKQKPKDLKRLRTQSNFVDKTTITYIKKVLASLETLLINDNQKQFIDGSKFDVLSESLSNLFTIDRFQYSDYMQMTQTLSSCLLKLCQYLTDDYQLKSLNLKILLLLRIKNPMMQQAIFTFMDKLIDTIQDRYLLFINDLVPFLIDNIHNRNEKVKIPIKSIINKFEELSGSKIENYIK